MSEDGKNIDKLITETRLLFQQISVLMKTVEETTKAKGWENRDGNSCFPRCPTHIDKPDEWLPNFFYRIFVNTKHPRIGLFVSVILVPTRVDEFEKDPPGEPLISAGYLKYLKDKSPKKADNFAGDDDCLWHLYHPVPAYDGSINRTTSNKLPKEYEPTEYFEELVSLALPLVDISDASDLETRIIKPILNTIS